MQEVLEPGVPSIAAVAVIALNLDDGFANLHSLPEPDESQRVGEPRIGVLLAVRLPHPATHEDVETTQLTAFLDYEEAEVVRVNIAAIIVGKRERHLELARQVAGPVDRLRLGWPARHLLAVEPDLGGRPRARQQMIRQPSRDGQRLLPQA